jgi:ABC-type multidrug transport system fused ATPase/permease subunit
VPSNLSIVEDACRKAKILEFIEGSHLFHIFSGISFFARDFDTEVGGKGSQLSGWRPET